MKSIKFTLFHFLSLFTVLVAVFLFGLLFPSASFAAPPSDFDVTELVGDLNQPTAFRFMPDGRIFIAEKEGAIKIFANGVVQPQPVITLITLQTDNADERGLLGIEPDPDFSQNGYLYVSYTTADNFDRLSRITVTGDTADLSSEIVLLESDQPGNVFHHGGEVRFGPDGKLYWAMGMNTINPNSQNLGNVHGKIHRINKDGTIPTDNPFYSTPGALKSIWAYGLRNPFRFDFLPDGRVITGDVGGDAWEEVNIIAKGGNYGWPLTEGTCSNCPYVNPIFTYHHTDPPAKAGSITSTLIYRGNTFPSQYQNAFFYGDYTLGFIRYLVFDSEFQSVISDNEFDNDAGSVVQLTQGPDGNIYKLTFFPGTLSKIAPSGGNRAPVAKFTPSQIAGLAPLVVNFDSSASFDSDEDELSYLWDFGNGQTSTEANPSHTFVENGTFNVTLTVSDGEKSDLETAIITVGNNLPTGVITSPAGDSKYNAGDTISYSAAGADPEDGELPDGAFSWNFYFHHADHIHPFWHPVNNQRSGQIIIPRTADNLANTWYEIQLTTTDSQGLSVKTSTFIYPNLVNLTFNVNVANVSYTIDGIPFTGTHSETAVVGVERVLAAPSPQYAGDFYYEFDHWSDGLPATHTITTPSADTTYVVNFNQLQVPPAPWQTLDVGLPTVSGNASYLDGVFTVNGAGGDIWGPTDEFRYVYQEFSGNGEIIARVISQDHTDDWAKSGIMFKETASEGAKYALLAATPANGISFQYNFNGDGGNTPFTFPNAWLKLSRFNNTFSAFTSIDGVNWQALGTTELDMAESITVGLFVTSHKFDQLNTSRFDNVTVTQNLTGLWQNTDVGTPKLAGSSVYNQGVFTVSGAGDDIWGDADQFQYVYRNLSGNGQITARVISQTTDTDGWAKAGVIIKQNTSPLSPYALLAVTPEHGLTFQSNFDTGTELGTFSFPNTYLRLVREGNLLTAYTSNDGLTWNHGGVVTINFPASVTVGLFVTSHNGSLLSTAQFDNVEVIESGQTQTLPDPFTGNDIGNPRLLGSASYNNEIFNLRAAGDDIWGDADQMYFVNRDLSGNGQITARITSQNGPDDWSKAGIIIKDSLAAGSNYALLAVTPANGIVMQYNFNSEVPGPAAYTFPDVYLRLVRVGSNISTYFSADGTNWQLIGTRSIDLAPTAKIGLFVTSHNGSLFSQATFTDVSVVETPNFPLPSSWQNTDVGAPTVAGSAQFDSGVFTVTGAGNDIWADTDQFHFVYQPLVGDGQITSRITSQTGSNDWAKAGLMIKNNLTAGSEYALFAVTPANGLAFQNSFNTNLNGQAYTFPDVYLRLVRVGSNISTYFSADGTNWQLYGTRALDGLNSEVLVGLFVTSHNGSETSTVLFDSVSVSSAN